MPGRHGADCSAQSAAPDRGQLFVPLFEYAEKLYEGDTLDSADARAFARRTVRGYLGGAAPGPAATY